LADTTIRLGSASHRDRPQDDSEQAQHATLCSVCKRHFSPSAEFCPYDGEKLRPHEFQPVVRDALIGSVIDDRYEVLAVIGEGGMGRVYRVRHRRLGRSFALKALRLELSQDPTLTQRFIQEARAAAAISHPNVVQINDFGTLPKGQPYFVMELLEGRTLTRILRQEGPIAPVRCVFILRQIAEALAAAHSMGVIHRDLKPDNVVVVLPTEPHMTVKVLDFGLAKVAANSRLTRPGVVFGTPHYLSPEQASGEPYDHRVDVYALGVMMFEMVTGRVPFEADTYMGVLSKHLYSTPPRLREYNADAGGLSGFEEIISGCLAKKPAERWPNMAELSRKLAALERASEVSPRHPLGTAATNRRVVGRQSQSLFWYTATVCAYELAALFMLLFPLARGSSSRLSAERWPTIGPPAVRPASNIRSLTPLENATSLAAPVPPPVSPVMATALSLQVASNGSPPAGLAPQAAKRGRAGSKVTIKNRKIPSLGSSDLADPWAK